MAINQVAKKELSSSVKAKISDLEEKIFKGVCSNRYFEKEMAYPFAVLENDLKKVVLGSNAYVANRVNNSPVLKREISEIVSTAIGGVNVCVEVKNAKDEFLEAQKRIDKKVEQAKKEERILAEVEEQKNKGRCNLIPFPVKENKVRSDLTVERHALFAANTFKGDFRAHERKLRDPKTGEVSKLRVEIGDPTGRVSGVLKQKHQEAFYKLSQLWSKQNYKIKKNKESEITGSIKLSVYDLVQMLRGNDGGRNYKDVFQLIDEMSTIRINIEKINSIDDTYDVQNFTLLSYRWRAKGFNKETLMPNAGGESIVSICFSDFVTDSFLRKNVKSLMLDPYFQLKDQGRKGVSQLLYTMLDYELSTKEKFNISLIKLSNRLGLAQYQHKSDRRRKLEPPINRLNGKEILGGKNKIDCSLTESEDGKDWVLIARKVLP